MTSEFPEAAKRMYAEIDRTTTGFVNGTWWPEAGERQIAADLVMAARLPAPASLDLRRIPLEEKLQRLAVWAPLIEAALHTAGHTQPAPAGPATSPGLTTLLDAAYPPAALVNSWSALLKAISSSHGEATATERLAEHVPGLHSHVENAQRAFDGFAPALGVLLTAIASGDNSV